MYARRHTLSKFAALGVTAAVGLQLLGAPSWGQVTTDLPDYAPGSVVTISGQNTTNPETGLLTPGYVSGKTVTVVAVGPDVAEPLTRWTDTCSAVVDEVGTWSCQVTLSADPAIAVGDYTYTATSEDADGQPIVETGTFKDGNTDISGFVRDSAAVAIAGAIITCSSGCNSSASTTSAANGSFSLHASFSGNGPSTLTLTVSASGYATQTVTFTGVVNNVNNSAGTITLVSADSTPPVISYVLSPATPDGSNGWYRSNVTLTWTVTESESPGSLIKTGCVNQSIIADQAATSYSCSATSTGGSSGTTTVSIKRDATAPGVSWSGALAVGGNFTYGAVPPVATCAATDATSGPGTCTVTGYSTALGSHTLTATAYDNAGNSTIETRNYSVIAATLTITAKDRSKTYGQSLALGSTEFTVSGLVGSDTVTSVTLTSAGAAAGAAVAGSPYAIVASAAVGTGLDNYTIGYVNGSLTVDPAALTVTANSFHKTYGDDVPFDGTEFTVSGLLNSDTVTSVTLNSLGTAGAAGVGDYDINIAGAAGTGVNNYVITYVGGTLTVDPADLTVTANSFHKTYGDDVPFDGSEFTVSGLLNSDTVTSVTLDSDGAAAGATVAGSPYAIVASAAVGTGLGNYDIGYVNGSLTVDPADLTVTANSFSKTYGDAVTFDGTEFTVSGLLNADTVDSVALNSLGTAGAAGVGDYDINIYGASGSGVDNYVITYVGGTLTVDPADLTVTANNRSKIYGQSLALGNTEFTVSGLLNSDTVTSVTLDSDGAAAGATVAGSPYAIVASAAVGAGLGNYDITYLDGTLTVDKATLTVMPGTGQSAQYSDPTPPLGFAVTGFVNDETGATAEGYVAPSCTTTRTVGSAPGTYPITCSGGSADNYTFSYNPTHVLFTVTQENGIVTYTGPLFVTTSSATATTVSIPLSATVQDINDLSTGGYRGDIRNAKVTFYKDGVAIPGCTSLTVSAIGSDTTTGTAGCSFTGTVNGSYEITVGVNGYYTGLTEASSVLTVAPGGGTNFITGGGWLAEAISAGTYGADAGTRLNFGFNVKYNKAKTNLQGQANIIFRRGGHTYQIKSNAISSLMVNSTGTKGTASFISKASLNDVTNPFSPIALLGGLTLTLTMTDNGEPGSADTIGIQVMDGGTLVFSSTWSGVTTTQKLLNGGNLVVH